MTSEGTVSGWLPGDHREGETASEPCREVLGPLGIDEAIQRHSFDSLTQKATVRFWEFTLHPQPGTLPLEFLEPFPLIGSETLPLIPVDLVLAYLVPKGRVIDT
ncbi:MAG: hypothetical protein OXS29_14745 [bacterium]|nr:hypothetical protein [bacterium]MDE0438532.1 hypothetical protein [bacterium]